MTDKEIDAALDAVLRAAGSGLRYYSMQLTLDRMREAMRKAVDQAEANAELNGARRASDLSAELGAGG